MMATTIFLYDHVSEYAAQVRVALADLSPEQVDDLTDGLEADLMEAVEDPAAPSGSIPVVDPDDAPQEPGRVSLLDLSARFGAPADYAQELRAAAGLPVATAVPPARRRGPVAALQAMGDDILDTVADARKAVTGHPRWPAVKEFVLVLRPAWWVARAAVLAAVVASVVGGRGAFLLAFVGLTVVSVQYGRGRWTVGERWDWAPKLLSALALVLLLPFAETAANGGGGESATTEYYNTVLPEDGVYVNGELVSNLFVFGPDGTFVDGAQIVDDEGRPVRIGQDDVYDPSTGTSQYFAPRTDEYGRAVPNAYPVPTFDEGRSAWEDGVGTVLRTGEEADVPAPPVAQLAPLDRTGEDDATDPTPSPPSDGDEPAARGPADPPADVAPPLDPEAPATPEVPPVPEG